MTTKDRKAINRCMNGFDFETAQRRYREMGWRWFRDIDPPTVQQLKDCARSLLIQLVEDGVNNVATGGLLAVKLAGGTIGLIMAAEEFLDDEDQEDQA